MSSSRSSAGVLPAPGTKFASATHLRLAVHEACLERGYEMRVNRGGITRGELRGRLASQAARSQPNAGNPCSFRVLWISDPEGVNVTQSNERHSCRAALRKQREAIAREWSRTKIDELRSKLPQNALRPTNGPSDAAIDSEEATDSDEDEEDESSRRRSSRLRTQGKRYKPGQSLVDSLDSHENNSDQAYSDGEEYEAEQSADASGTREKAFEWPHVSEVREEAVRMAQAARIPTPNVGDTFDTPRDLLVHIHAFAQQSGFAMHRRRGDENGSWVVIGCSKGNNRGKRSPEGGCPCLVEAHRSDDGSYTLSKVVLPHNHAVSLRDNATPDVASTSASTPIAGPSNSQATTSFFSPPPRPSPQRFRFHFGTAQPQLQPASGFPAALTFVGDLKALISLLIPDLSPASTSRLATTLIGTGVNSISDLANFLIFEIDTTLPKFLEGLAYREGDDVAEDAFLFFQLMRMYSMDNA
ncbi:hypothetical protein NBRC10513v2_001938 [Rhodotorula toruloides]|uniref:Uncharacterized protein n=1 Tax=Rhodotorula toruloides TaxID=5286 RepID=A0A2T0A7S3_RHOTO|nr:hypothetical protein AAT19DRAFT_15620 [Rhodotorula toruloides]